MVGDDDGGGGVGGGPASETDDRQPQQQRLSGALWACARFVHGSFAKRTQAHAMNAIANAVLLN